MKAYIGIGSNQGDRMMYIEKAVKALGHCVRKISSIYETEPVEMDCADKFLNAVVEIDTNYNPFELLDFLEDIEKKLGRTEKGNYKKRTIDLDILLYGDSRIDTDRLKIPHPKIHERDFVRRPLEELWRKS